MNKRCIYQQELMHAWANKTPEGKKREREYNLSYYQLNKEDWKRRKALREQHRVNTVRSVPIAVRQTIRRTETPMIGEMLPEKTPKRKTPPAASNESIVPTAQDFREVFDLGATIAKGIGSVGKAVGKLMKKVFSLPAEAAKLKTNEVKEDIGGTWKMMFNWLFGR